MPLPKDGPGLKRPKARQVMKKRKRVIIVAASTSEICRVGRLTGNSGKIVKSQAGGRIPSLRNFSLGS